MAMGLGFLGRGRHACAAWGLGLLHVLGAALAGAVAGVLLATSGNVLALHSLARWLLVPVISFALWYSWRRKPVAIGRRQVPRSWQRTMHPVPRFLLWGMMLGAGALTVIPYPVYLLVPITQLISGSVALGGISGAICGGCRAAAQFIPLLNRAYRVHPDQMPRLLRSLALSAHRINIFLILSGGILLIISAGH